MTRSVVRGEMAQQRNQVDRVKISCSICLDLLKDPVTISCGHNYCMSCIKTHWDEEDRKRIHSCPQCRTMFTPRPDLMINTMLAALVEKRKKTGLKAAAADHCYAGAEDVACDVCTGRKLKALKSCLDCRASYCGKHLQPHYESATFEQHKLVEPSKKLQDNICSRHNEVMNMFCRTDQQCICYLCTEDEHKSHDTVSAAAERTERQRELEGSRQQTQQRIQDREKDVKVLQQEVEAISRSADKAVEHSEDVFTELIRLLEKRRSDVKQQIRSQQETEVSRVKELQQKLEQEITELKRKDAGLEQLSHTEDPTQFLLNYPSVSALSQSTGSTSANVSHQMYFEDVTTAVSEVRNNMVAVLSETWTQTEHKTRADFLQYLCQVTLDPNTANNYLVLSKGNRSITCNDKYKPYPEHPDRFSDVTQVLSKDGLTGRCYWEVEMSGYVTTAVAYKSISRSGDFNTDVFGYNDKSWVLHCSNCCTFIHNKISAPISGLPSCRLGVYLDHSAGVLCFYSVSPPRTMTLLHRVQTTFTEPLYAGLGICGLNGDTAELCELKHIDLQKQAMEKINNESLQ